MAVPETGGLLGTAGLARPVATDQDAGGGCPTATSPDEPVGARPSPLVGWVAPFLHLLSPETGDRGGCAIGGCGEGTGNNTSGVGRLWGEAPPSCVALGTRWWLDAPG